MRNKIANWFKNIYCKLFGHVGIDVDHCLRCGQEFEG